jgi:hypothetical protein
LAPAGRRTADDADPDAGSGRRRREPIDLPLLNFKENVGLADKTFEFKPPVEPMLSIQAPVTLT